MLAASHCIDVTLALMIGIDIIYKRIVLLRKWVVFAKTHLEKYSTRDQKAPSQRRRDSIRENNSSSER